MDLVSTTLTLDRERTLKADYDAIERLSNLPLARRGGRSPIELWGAANGLDVKAMAMMVWALNFHEDRRWTIDDAEKIIRRALKSGATTYKQLNETLNAAINQSDVLGIFQPNDDGDEANPTTPPMPRLTALSPGASSPPVE